MTKTTEHPEHLIHATESSNNGTKISVEGTRK